MSGFCARASALGCQVARRARCAIEGCSERAERTYSRRANRTQASRSSHLLCIMSVGENGEVSCEPRTRAIVMRPPEKSCTTKQITASVRSRATSERARASFPVLSVEESFWRSSARSAGRASRARLRSSVHWPLIWHAGDDGPGPGAPSLAQCGALARPAPQAGLGKRCHVGRPVVGSSHDVAEQARRAVLASVGDRR